MATALPADGAVEQPEKITAPPEGARRWLLAEGDPGPRRRRQRLHWREQRNLGCGRMAGAEVRHRRPIGLNSKPIPIAARYTWVDSPNGAANHTVITIVTDAAIDRPMKRLCSR